MQRPWISALALALFGLPAWAGTAAAKAPVKKSSADSFAQVQAAAQQTQQQCYALIHHDTDEFAECVAQRAAAPALSDEERLGTQYFGWVGAINSMRMGMPGAREAAVRFLPPFRAAQQRLKLDDDALCRVVPGDCVARNARMRQMEQELPAATTPASGPSRKGTPPRSKPRHVHG